MLGRNYISYTRIYGMSLEFVILYSKTMLTYDPSISRAVSRTSRCSGNINHSEYSLTQLPRWNRLIAELSWEPLTGAEGWLVCAPHQSPCHWMVLRKTRAHPLQLTLALLSICVSALQKTLMEPDYLVKYYIII